LEIFDEYSDEQIVDLVHSGDKLAQDYIITKYKKLVTSKSKPFFIKGADKDDIIQEGTIGLYKSITEFDKNRQVSFHSFASLCISRQILTAIKTATRQKHIPLNSSLSLDKTVSDNVDGTYVNNFIESKTLNPEELLIDKEEKNYIANHINEALSNFENRVLALYLQGYTYVNIANKIQKDEKAIDNAIQRIRKKVEKILIDKNLNV
jgi:RNA polymerase sporulation-specific sigma factor